MKCNCKIINNLSISEREKLKKALNEYETKFLKTEEDKLKLIITSNLLKIFVVACNRTVGIGKVRLEKILNHIYKSIEDCAKDEAFFEHVDKICLDILGKPNFDKYFLNL